MTDSLHDGTNAEQQLWGVSEFGSYSDRDLHAGQSMLCLSSYPPT